MTISRACGRDHMVVGFTIYNYVVSSNCVHGEMYLIKHYVIKFVSDLRQISGFLWILWFPPRIKTDATL